MLELSMVTTVEETRVVRPTLPDPVFHACDGGFRKGEFVVEGCRQRSYYFATVNGTVLSFCGHHADEYEVGLMPVASKIVDLRHTILPPNPPVE